MLSTLYIENLAVIEKAIIDFNKGFTVFTGETGAGKSIVIDAINTCLGQRANREIVRTGTEKSSVMAIFTDISDEAVEFLKENGYEVTDNELSVLREIYADGRSTAKISSKPVTVSLLKELGSKLLNIHGQHDNQILLNPDRHLDIIDDYGELSEDIKEYRKEFDILRDDIRLLRSLAMDENEKRRRIDTLTYQIDEISAASLKPGIEEEIKKEAEFFKNSEKIATALSVAVNALSGENHSGAVDLLYNAKNSVEGIEEFSGFKKSAQTLETLAIELGEVLSYLKSELDRIEYDPIKADKTERLLNDIHHLKSKYGATVEDVILFREKALEELHKIESADEELKVINERAKVQKQKVIELANKLTNKRKDASDRFIKEVVDAAKFLEMPNLRLEADFTPCKLNKNGDCMAELLISSNLGEPPKPIAKIASGGELSRVMLAIKSALADKDKIATLIFDEVDTGVSGKAAQKIGVKLKEVSKSRQVLCVTHSAQVASLADNQLLISKHTENERTYTEVKLLNDDERIREIARIMSTDKVTDLMLKNAECMLNDGKNITF